MKDIKAQFNTLQSNVTKLNNQKIGLESEIKTISADQKELIQKILELTGKADIDEAFKFYTEQSQTLEERKEKLSIELNKYADLNNGVD